MPRNNNTEDREIDHDIFIEANGSAGGGGSGSNEDNRLPTYIVTDQIVDNSDPFSDPLNVQEMIEALQRQANNPLIYARSVTADMSTTTKKLKEITDGETKIQECLIKLRKYSVSEKLKQALTKIHHRMSAEDVARLVNYIEKDIRRSAELYLSNDVSFPNEEEEVIISTWLEGQRHSIAKYSGNFRVNVNVISGEESLQYPRVKPIKISEIEIETHEALNDPHKGKRLCNDCDEWESEEDGQVAVVAGSTVWVCSDCYDMNYFSCQDCGNHYHLDDLISEDEETGEEIQVCDECYNHNRERIDYREYASGVGDDKEIGNTIKSLRPFGIELEIYTDTRKQVAGLSKSIDKEIGIGSDGSISGGYGLEIRTPIRNGKYAEEMINELCDKMERAKTKVNQSCGYHIHVNMDDVWKATGNDGERLKYRAFKCIWSFYMTFEDVIMSFLPKSRLTNRYCSALRSEYHLKELLEAGSLDDMDKIWYRLSSKESVARAKSDSKNSTRYRGINMHTLLSDGHIEIRYHSGTRNKRKILEWANLHLKIADIVVEWAKGNSTNIDGVDFKTVINNINLAEKTNFFFKIMGLPKSSEDYFRARQAHFLETNQVKVKPISKKTEKAVKELMLSEVEL